jgi:hypothetical protein
MLASLARCQDELHLKIDRKKRVQREKERKIEVETYFDFFSRINHALKSAEEDGMIIMGLSSMCC